MTADSIGRSRLFWRLQVAGWMSCGLLGLAFATAYFGIADALVAILPRTAFGFLVTCGLRPFYRFLWPRLTNIWVSGVAIFIFCGGLALLDAGFTAAVAFLFKRDFDEGALRQFFVSSILMRWMVYWLWSVLYFGINFWLKTEHAKLRVARAEAEARASELRFLQAQINPHFLYNALNTILAETDNEHTRSLVQALAEYLRFSARKHDALEPMGEELSAIEYYLQVEKARFEERFVYEVEADDAARGFYVPVATVQPLVENAIKYGRHTSPSLLKLKIAACVADGRLCVEVRNSGRWVPSEESRSTQTGLENLRRRLSLFYGENASLCLTHDAVEVVAKLLIPVIDSHEYYRVKSLGGG